MRWLESLRTPKSVGRRKRHPQGGVKKPLMTITFLAMIYLVYTAQQTPPSKAKTNTVSTQTTRATLTPAPNTAKATPAPTWQKATLRKGDSLSKIFHRQHVTQRQLAPLSKHQAFKKASRRLQPGQQIALAFDEHHQLVELKLPIDATQSLHVHWPNASTVDVATHAKALQSKQLRSQLHINHSLSKAAQAAGLSQNMTQQLVTIFGDRINMQRDLQSGDTFTVLYTAYTLNGQRIKTGPVQAASYTHRGQSQYAIRFQGTPEQQAQYYDLHGNNWQNAFSRKPCNYKRISSPFNPKRLHPILGVRRPHYGVDLAAAQGTPVHAVAEGDVMLARYQGGYGRVVKLQHGSNRSTVYAHLSRFAHGLKKNQHVHKGDVIAYVGSTGFATGPHLHFELRLSGKPQNPLTAKIPEGKALNPQHQTAFQAQAQAMQVALSSPHFSEQHLDLPKPQQHLNG